MKRFSVKVFVLVTIMHVIGTILLIDASFAELRAMKQAMASSQPEPSFLWLTVLSWIWCFVPMLISRLFMGFTPSVMFSITLLWSLWVGAICGALVPHLSARRRQIA